MHAHTHKHSCTHTMAQYNISYPEPLNTSTSIIRAVRESLDPVAQLMEMPIMYQSCNPSPPPPAASKCEDKREKPSHDKKSHLNSTNWECLVEFHNLTTRKVKVS